MRIDTAALAGRRPDRPLIEEVVRAGTREIEAMSDLQVSAAYRLRVAVGLGARALLDACADAASRDAAIAVRGPT